MLCMLAVPVAATDIRHAENAVIINDGRWIGHHALVFEGHTHFSGFVYDRLC